MSAGQKLIGFTGPNLGNYAMRRRARSASTLAPGFSNRGRSTRNRRKTQPTPTSPEAPAREHFDGRFLNTCPDNQPHPHCPRHKVPGAKGHDYESPATPTASREHERPDSYNAEEYDVALGNRRKSRKRIGTYVDFPVCALGRKCAHIRAISARRSAYQQGRAHFQRIRAQCAARFEKQRRRKSRKRCGTYVEFKCESSPAIVAESPSKSPALRGPDRPRR